MQWKMSRVFLAGWHFCLGRVQSSLYIRVQYKDSSVILVLVELRALIYCTVWIQYKDNNGASVHRAAQILKMHHRFWGDVGLEFHKSSISPNDNQKFESVLFPVLTMDLTQTLIAAGSAGTLHQCVSRWYATVWMRKKATKKRKKREYRWTVSWLLHWT